MQQTQQTFSRPLARNNGTTRATGPGARAPEPRSPAGVPSARPQVASRTSRVIQGQAPQTRVCSGRGGSIVFYMARPMK